MALKIWLPLNGNLDNIGTRRSAIALVGTPTVNNGGKIGSCYTFNGSNGISVAEQILPSQAPEWSFACWFKLANTTSTAGAALFSERTGGNYNGYTIFLYPNNSKMLIDDGVRWTVTPMTFSANVWYHLVITRSLTGKKLYVNGELKSSTATIGSTSAVNTNGCLIGLAQSGTSLTAGNQGFIGDLNDVRIYNHCLSVLEIKEISQGLILHYKLSSQKDVPNDNLFLKTRMTASDRSGWVKNNSTDFTKLIRYYNGSSGIHSFAALPDGEYEDTVTLSTTGNLGIAFLRSATDINLDSSSYYTLSCEAKCNVAGKSLAIGTSYYTTGNAWTWRGGANAKAFTAVDTWQTFTLTFKPDANTQYICYCFTVNQGTANSAEKFTIRHCKLEKGSEVTKWQPAPEELEMGASSDKIIDSSGYGNNGTASTTLTVQRDGGRYGSSTLLDQKKITCSPCFPQIADPVFTVSLWFKLYSNITYTSYADLISIPATNSSQLFRLELCGSPAGANLEWFRGPTGTSGGFTVGPTTSGWYTLDEWHHTVLVGEGNKQYTCYFDGVQTNTYNGSANTWTPTGAITLGDTIQGTANFSDFRVYTTALSADDVANLYHTSAHVDKSGKFHAFEFIEDAGNSVKKNGIIQCNEIIEETIPSCQYDSQIYTEPDGSKWIHIYHINNPGAGSFASTDSFATGVYKDANRWFDATRVCNQLNKWEFLVKYKFTSSGTEYKERWVQNKNPENAVFGDVDAADITRITTSGYKTGTWGGLYKKNASAYWVMNNGNSGNWWGATGGFSIYQSGTPGYGGTVTTTGFNDLYVRIDNIQINAKITKTGNYIGCGFIEK